jgi:alpha-N-acetylglucosamine transferase
LTRTKACLPHPSTLSLITNLTNIITVWTVLITNLDYLPGLLTMHHSLVRVKSAYPLIALYTDTFPESGLTALKSRGIATKHIKYILPSNGKDYSTEPRFFDCWTKLTPFSLTEYDRVVQLDADMLLLQNMDELMDIPLDDAQTAAEGNATGADGKPISKRVFAAGHACVCNPLHKPHYPSDWIPSNCAFTTQHSHPDEAQTTAPPNNASPLGYLNGGLQVVRPNAALFSQIESYMTTRADALDFADQSLLSELFAGRWVPLPYVYNALKTLRWKGVHDAIWRDDEVKNVHYILTPNPWEEIDAEGKNLSTDESHEWWAAANRERKAEERARGIDDGF